MLSIKVEFGGGYWAYANDDEIPANSIVKATDTIVNPFRISLINGYTKSQKTFDENARVKEVELWLNGEHMCNVELQDVPDVQVIEGNFPFFKDDLVEIKPVAFYEGTKYDDVCISEMQQFLAYIIHPDIKDHYDLEDYAK